MARLLQIHPRDNVAVALDAIAGGERIAIVSSAGAEVLQTAGPIPFAHKVALVDIQAGADVIKHGVAIGFATRAIQRGEWVHQQNAASHYAAEGDGQ